MQMIFAILIIIYVLVWRLPKHKNNFMYLKELIFSPKKFIVSSTEDAVKRMHKTNEHYNKDEKKQAERFNKQFSDATKRLRNSIYQAFITVLITSLFSWAIACLLAPLISVSANILSAIQMGSAFFILWAIVGKLGYPIQTIKGETLPEDIDNLWYIFLNVIGIFLLFFVQFYSFLKMSK